MALETILGSASDLTADDYVVLGFATCFIRNDGELEEVVVAEPVPSSYLEALFKAVPTAYQQLYGTTLGTLLRADAPQLPPEAPANTQLCNDFAERLAAAARTYKLNTAAKTSIPVGQSYTDLNYSTDKKRVLNLTHAVTPEDNVKQHAYTHQVL